VLGLYQLDMLVAVVVAQHPLALPLAMAQAAQADQDILGHLLEIHTAVVVVAVDFLLLAQLVSAALVVVALVLLM
jgi:hypothetical protein